MEREIAVTNKERLQSRVTFLNKLILSLTTTKNINKSQATRARPLEECNRSQQAGFRGRHSLPQQKRRIKATNTDEPENCGRIKEQQTEAEGNDLRRGYQYRDACWYCWRDYLC